MITVQKRSLLVAVAALAIGGCVTWEPTTLVAVESARPTQVRIERSADRPVRLRNPEIEEGRIVGLVWGTSERIERVRLEDVTRIQIRKRHVGRSLFLILPVSVLVFAAAWAQSGGILGGR